MDMNSSCDYGYGNNPLLWLITLGFLRGGNGLLGGNGAGGAVAAGQVAGVARANEGIACLGKGQTDLQQTQSFDRISAAMDAEGNRIVSAVGDLSNDFNSFSRDLSSQLCNGFNAQQVTTLQGNNALQAQLAACCCDLKSGQKDIVNAICNQTNELNASLVARTQSILDQNTNFRITDLETQLATCRAEKNNSDQTATLANIIHNCCCPCPAPKPAA